MKKSIFYAFLVVGFSTAVIAGPIASGGRSGSASPVMSGGAQQVTPVAPAGSVAPGTQTRTLQPQYGSPDGTQNGTQNAATTPGSTFNSNNVAGGSNSLSGTNAFAGARNNPAVTAAVSTNTGFAVPTNSNINGNTVTSDQAVTASDRVLLTTLSQGVRATLGVSANGNMPVHFMIRNGTVTVVGTVQSEAQSQSILSQVQQTPGVLSVASDLRVAPSSGALGVAGASGSTPLAMQKDHAFSSGDQVLLTTIQQQASTQLGIAVSSQMPVHFSIQNGVVGVTGQMASIQEKQTLLASISHTPGVVRVVDNVAVTGIVGFGSQSTVVPSRSTGTLPPTSRGPSSTNAIFLNGTTGTNSAPGL